MRRLVSPPVRPVSVVISADSWRRALMGAHSWAGYAERTVLLDEGSRLPALAATEADRYGFGMAVRHGDDVEIIVPSRAYSPRRFTPARWLLAEQIYGQYLSLTSDLP